MANKRNVERTKVGRERLKILVKRYGDTLQAAKEIGLAHVSVRDILSGKSGVGVASSEKIAKAFSALSTAVPFDENSALFARIERLKRDSDILAKIRDLLK